MKGVRKDAKEEVEGRKKEERKEERGESKRKTLFSESIWSVHFSNLIASVPTDFMSYMFFLRLLTAICLCWMNGISN